MLLTAVVEVITAYHCRLHQTLSYDDCLGLLALCVQSVIPVAHAPDSTA